MILNRLGIVASGSTHSKLVASVAEQREKEFQLEITQNAFCLASADNIDNKSGYAAAYVDKASIIFHGTSIQYVEPRPNSLPISSSVVPESPITRGPSPHEVPMNMDPLPVLLPNDTIDGSQFLPRGILPPSVPLVRLREACSIPEHRLSRLTEACSFPEH